MNPVTGARRTVPGRRRGLEISVHAYQALDWEIVHSMATERLGKFVEYGLAIEAALTGATGPET